MKGSLIAQYAAAEEDEESSLAVLFFSLFFQFFFLFFILCSFFQFFHFVHFFHFSFFGIFLHFFHFFILVGVRSTGVNFSACGGADEPSTASLRRGTRVLWMSSGTPECNATIQAG